MFIEIDKINDAVPNLINSNNLITINNNKIYMVLFDNFFAIFYKNNFFTIFTLMKF